VKGRFYLKFKALKKKYVTRGLMKSFDYKVFERPSVPLFKKVLDEKKILTGGELENTT